MKTDKEQVVQRRVDLMAKEGVRPSFKIILKLPTPATAFSHH